ncbi:hypothetical protein DC31_12120 [Microbacterium sp. CH12i]|uniref:hypothetical protein n=1 Tax=Microbacterium sp. CH12i TaxID=1479651 RepID=UPI0004612A3C|nr:hypothetical protein [Microbacterium sp. CH12i]KDA06172.1 hypothetical protein DC31_12120 [Microbacterium sp. CH12i]
MNTKKTAAQALGAILLGAVLAIAAPVMANATEHDATTTDGTADVHIDFGTEFADTTATVLILDADADPDAPTEASIAYVAEVLTDAEGVASFRASLPEGLDYWLASAADGGERYVAMLDGSEGSPGGDGSGDGDAGGDDDAGDSGDGAGDGGSDGGFGSGDSGQNDAASDKGDLATTGLAAWILPSSLLVAGVLIAAGTTLVRRRRARD